MLDQLIQAATQLVAQGPGPMGQLYLEAMKRFGLHAVQRWLPPAAAGLQCCAGPTTGCLAPAAGQCVGCQRLTCLGHAMASVLDGALVCAHCVLKVAPARAVPHIGPMPRRERERPRPAAAPEDARTARRRECLGALGLKDDATEQDIKDAYKELARMHHPDRQKDARRKARAEKRMKEINEARDWLLKEAA